MQEPFDPKWGVWVDDKPAQIYKAQGSFMAVKLSAGEHRVVRKYWPHHPIRFFLVISIVVSVASLIWILIYAVRQKEQ